MTHRNIRCGHLVWLEATYYDHREPYWPTATPSAATWFGLEATYYDHRATLLTHRSVCARVCSCTHALTYLILLAGDGYSLVWQYSFGDSAKWAPRTPYHKDLSQRTRVGGGGLCHRLQ